jgi:phage-related protein
VIGFGRKEEKSLTFEEELVPTTTTNTVAEGIAATKEPAVATTSSRKPSKVTRQPQQKELQKTISSKSISKQLDKQTTQINKKITQILQPFQNQSQLIKQLQSQLKQLQKQVSQIQRAVSIGKRKKT